MVTATITDTIIHAMPARSGLQWSRQMDRCFLELGCFTAVPSMSSRRYFANSNGFATSIDLGLCSANPKLKRCNDPLQACVRSARFGNLLLI